MDAHIHRRNGSGYVAGCSGCRAMAAAHMRRMRANNPEYRERQRVAKQKRLRKKRAWLRDLKLSIGCVDCGYAEHSAALDFDHLPGYEKTQNVGYLVEASKKRILEEIAKCELVCANCHRVRTYNRMWAA